MEIVQRLAHGIGERPAGSPADQAAAEFLLHHLTDAGLKASLERFTFRGWRALAPGLVKLSDGSTIDAVALPYTPPTGPAGISGRIIRDGEWPVIPRRLVCSRFTLCDQAGDAVAAILVSPTGKARLFPNVNPLLALPTVVVGASEGDLLTQHAESEPESPTLVRSPPAWEGPLQSQNIVIDERQAERAITVTAHYDCVAGSAGANDNASGAALLVRLATRLRQQTSGNIGFRFVLTGAEEPFLVGSRKHVSELAAAGLLPRIAACLNLDMVAVGQRFSIRRSPGAPWQDAAEALGGTSPSGLQIGETGPMASSDQWSFHEVGIPSAQLTREPDPAWHSPEDIADRFSSHELDEAEEVAVALLNEAAARCANHPPIERP